VQLVGSAEVVDRRGWEARLDQLQPATIDDAVTVVGRHRDGPAEVMSDAESHAPSLAQPPAGRANMAHAACPPLSARARRRRVR
jgi:hypothetical protein